MSLATRARQALCWAVLLCCGRATLAAEPAKSTPPPQNSAPPDAEFIEFLGADDVGDADWWEFLGSARPAPGKRKPAQSAGADEDEEHE